MRASMDGVVLIFVLGVCADVLAQGILTLCMAGR